MKICPGTWLGFTVATFALGAMGSSHSARAADAASGSGSTPPSAANPDNSYSKLARADSGFLVKAARINAEQAIVARLATTRSTTPEVRAFAEDLVVAYDAMASNLSRLAAAKTVTLGSSASESLNQKWSEKKAADFERDYVNETATVLAQAASLYQEVIRDGKDPDVATLAREQLSALTDNLHRAEDLQKLLK